ncbi:MAG: sigma-70 family RNA polymerase sigma factor [Thermoleophilia bacterium]
MPDASRCRSCTRSNPTGARRPRRPARRGRARRALRPLRAGGLRLALRIVRDAALAEDAVQDAFLAVWRSADRFAEERAKASTWILTLVHRRAVDVVRREERRRADPLEAAAEPSGDATDEQVWQRAQRERVRAALARLPDAQREALELAYWGGLTQTEIAERLAQPLGTIKSRMFSGLARLRELLADEEEGA